MYSTAASFPRRLRDLEANNDRDWFKANRERYDTQLVDPARELAAQLAHLGEPHLFRPYNDTRFHMRPPIKEQLGLTIGYGGAGGYYVELSLDGLLVAAGLHHAAPDQLERFRAAMDDDFNTAGALAALFELVRAINTARDAGTAGASFEAAQATLTELAGVLGLTLEEPAATGGAEAAPFIELLVRTRAQLRAAKQWALADQLRKELGELGVILEDSPTGTTWRWER